ncbi:Maf family protein [Rhabdaerophilum sp. SD176]|uniref:Maf family protein n=1 Tax=Rhabdaerophilum sp. SD176 TaxID=2983548 RepID=UPI0024E00876|nr:Maf family protein [Rhabdaerophilum sp. SD176]
MNGSTFWKRGQPLLLASGSATRRQMLEAAGIPLVVVRAPVDEGAIAATLLETRRTPAEIAIALAHAKAEAAARKHPEELLLAADQTLDHQGRLLMKPADLDHARAQLLSLRGTAHFLHSAAVLRRGDSVLWAGIASASLQMRNFSAAFLDAYLDSMGPLVTTTVGGYQLEALGIHLFDSIEGDHSTILGLPLIPVLHALRDLDCLAA